jgi:hypothetical protein
MSGIHSRFAPSSAHRLVECPASLLLNEQERDEPSYDAVLGTVAHWVHEHWLLTGKRPDDLVGKRPWSFMGQDELSKNEWQIVKQSYFDERGEIIVSEAMLNYVEESVQACLELPGDRFVEKRVDISPWCPEFDEHGKPVPKQGGTADFFACSPGLLEIADLKYGTGVQVFAEKNYQAIMYALGVINEYDWEYDFRVVRVRIHQPRLNHFDVWETTKEELLKIGKYIKSRYELALKPNPTYGASEKACQFCKVKSKCAHLAEQVLSHFDFEDDATTEDVKLEAAFLSLERQVEIFKMRGLFKMWIGSIEHDIEGMLRRVPNSVPGLKLVNGRSFRAWSKPETARDELLFAGFSEDQIYKPREMISPAQAEKLKPAEAEDISRKEVKNIVAELTVKPLGGPVIVDSSDPRPEYVNDSSNLATKHFDADNED